MLTCRTLHFSRAQSSATVVTRPETTSSSHRRPRAMALTRQARRSNCSGRMSLRDALCGSRILRDLLEGGFCQGIVSNRSSGRSDAPHALSDLSLMISLSPCTTIPATSSARSPRSPKGRVAVADLPWLAARCSFNDFTMTSSMSAAGMRKAGKGSPRSSDSGLRLWSRGSGPCDGRRRRTAILPVGDQTCCVQWCGETIGRGISAGPRQTARDP